MDAASNMESSSTDNEDPFADEQGFAIKSHIADLNEDEDHLAYSSLYKAVNKGTMNSNTKSKSSKD